MPPAIGAIKDTASGTWTNIKRRFPWLAHVVNAYSHYTKQNGNYLAAAITFFSFLALFPLILLVVSVAGFVLAHDQSLLTKLTNSISSHVPGSFGTTLHTAVNTAIQNRAGIGVVGLVGVLLSGLGWISNLRTAISAVWGVPVKKRNFISSKLANAAVLAGLGLAILVSLGLTAGGTAATGVILKALSLQHETGMGVLTRVIGIVLAVAGDVLIFGWMIIKLPDVDTPRRLNVKAALLASVGFEVLKVIGSYYIGRVSKSPTVSIFGSVVGVLLFIYLVARFLLYCVAWAATGFELVAAAEGTLAAGTAASDAVTPEPYLLFGRPLSGYALSLLAAGAAMGAAVMSFVRRSDS
jgi:membrane protein